MIVCLWTSLKAQAVNPPPDGGYPNFTTAEGQNALFSLTTGSANTAVSWFSLWRNAEGSFNTATGAGALLFNTADENTAFGAAALLFNTSGVNNTATGGAALLNNTEGGGNTAVGDRALFSNATRISNTAVGHNALFTNNGNPSFGEGCFNCAFLEPVRSLPIPLAITKTPSVRAHSNPALPAKTTRPAVIQHS